MKINDAIKINVNNFKEILKLGYTQSQYYCGLSKYQSIATTLRDKLQKLGLKFPFNPACFKHDICYGVIFKISKWNLPKRLGVKLLVDFIFLIDMFKILNSKNYTTYERKFLRNRAIMFYFIVTFGTIFYIFYLIFEKIDQIFKKTIQFFKKTIRNI